MSTFWLSWRDDLNISLKAGGELELSGPRERLVFKHLSPAIGEALEQLKPPGQAEDFLADHVLEADGAEALARWYYHLRQLDERGFCCHAVHVQGQRLATLEPIASPFQFQPPAITPDQKFILSRFALMRRVEDDLILESPLAKGRVIIHDCRAAGLIAALAVPGSVADLADRAGDFPNEAVSGLVSLLAAANMIDTAGPKGTPDEPPALQSWEFHDLLFHARSRQGRSDAPFGGTYRLWGRLPMPPALKLPRFPEIELYRPDLDALMRQDPPLARVQEDRQSIRRYGSRPITARQLGEFLYRTARVKDYREQEVATPHGPVRMDLAPRPYPAGGALYELEVYLAVQACENLAPGLYHYNPLRHGLGQICGRTADLDHLLRDAGQSTAIPPEHLQVLIILAARFQRIAWKYAALAYALILKHVGVVIQTMYLAATAMDLAPCGIGGGNSDLFARAASTDYYAETSVGEFLLGSKEPPS